MDLATVLVCLVRCIVTKMDHKCAVGVVFWDVAYVAQAAQGHKVHANVGLTLKHLLL